MSGLNDEFEAELTARGGSDTFLSDYVPAKDPSQEVDNNPAFGKTTFMAKYGVTPEPTPEGKEPTISDLFGENVTPGVVPNLQVKIALIGQNNGTLSDAITKQEVIQTRGVISQEDMVELNSILPGVVSDTTPIEYYTQSPTKTSYIPALNALSRCVGKVFSENKILINELAVEILKGLTDTQSWVLKTFTEKIDDKAQYVVKLLEQYNQAKAIPSVNPDCVVIHSYVIEPLCSIDSENVLEPFKTISDELEIVCKTIISSTAYNCLVVAWLNHSSDNEMEAGKLWVMITSTTEGAILTMDKPNLSILELLSTVLSEKKNILSGAIMSLLTQAETTLRPLTENIYPKSNSATIDQFKLSHKTLEEYATVITKVTSLVRAMNSSELAACNAFEKITAFYQSATSAKMAEEQIVL